MFYGMPYKVSANKKGHLYLHLLNHSVDVKHSTVASTDDGLVLQNDNLGIEQRAHVAQVVRVTQHKARGNVLPERERDYVCVCMCVCVCVCVCVNPG